MWIGQLCELSDFDFVVGLVRLTSEKICWAPPEKAGPCLFYEVRKGGVDEWFEMLKMGGFEMLNFYVWVGTKVIPKSYQSLKRVRWRKC